MLGRPTPHKRRPATKKKIQIRVPVNVQKAKEHPIENLYAGELKKSNKVKMGRCPFHEESTPSFAIYPATNTWYCFACKDGGDVIKFYQQLNSVSFQDAVEALTK